MNRHQILSGACNAGDKCYAVGSVEGIPFTAYAAGCNIVILASTFERVQIIPGAVHSYIKISALDSSTDTGKIAAAYGDKICIFEPTPLIHTDSDTAHNLEYKWVQTGSFTANSFITSLSWNLEGTRLLTGGTNLQMWREKLSAKDENEPTVVKFEIGGDREVKTPTNEKDEESCWECIWICQTASPVHHMSFSPDGTLFATSGKNDRLVKIWYENKHVLFPTKSFDSSQYKSGTFEESDCNFSFVYIAHPRAVTHVSWRKTSKYMPKGSVSNMLVTSCLDNICRIWIETVLPDDGLVNMSQFDPLASQNPKFRTHRHKHRFMQRLKHMKTCFHIRRHAKNGAVVGNVMSAAFGNHHVGGDINFGHSPIPSLPSTYSVHDFHSYGYHGTGVSPGMHFHLAASINAETDIPLVPSMQTTDPTNQPNFILHWLNNKEMYFSLQAESILQELTRKIIEKEDTQDLEGNCNNNNNNNSNNNNVEETTTEVHRNESKKKFTKIKSFSHEDNSNSEEHSSRHSTMNQSGLPNINSMSNTTSLNSIAPDNASMHVVDSLDMKIDCLLRDWHHSPDLLFSIHPVDGSYLIWVIEWLDDYYPGSFRQAQVSFSTRIPSAFPLGDAMSMSTTVSLYNTGTSPLYFREMVRGAKKQTTATSQEHLSDTQVTLPSVLEEQEGGDIPYKQNTEDDTSTTAANKQENEAELLDKVNNQSAESLFMQPSPSISMVTKHSNGTLNLWQLIFADKTKFTQVLSIGHICRASGHRFRVNDITCHPVLPLLLTTSHHNMPDVQSGAHPNTQNSFQNETNNKNKDVYVPSGFCSELILWRVDSVGPLSHSGGVSELARINSPEISAFSNVAWIPTLLPSTTLGSYSNSPSACFVASDGESLRVYQAVIDARTLLAEISFSERLSKKADSMISLSSECSSDNVLHKTSLHDKIKIVSQQSTARPGCVIQLDAIADATHDWQNTQFLHVFQEQLITGEKNEDKILSGLSESVHVGLMESHLGAIVDLQRNSEFEEPFYIVIIERTTKGSTIHMWRIVIASKPQTPYLSESAMYVPDSNIIQDLDDQDPGPRHSVSGHQIPDDFQIELEAPHVTILTKKVCTQELPLPDGVDVIHASPAAGHLSSSSIYPACFAPYIIVTACSDSTTRFWKCNINNVNEKSQEKSYEWCEWKMFSKQQDSAIEICGQPLNISAAYSGRIACAYKYGKSFTRPNKGDPESRYVNLCVAIYECESTGGSEWVLEDTIHLRNVHLPRIQIDPNLDLSYLHDSRFLQKKQRLNQVLQTFTHDENRSPRSGDITPDHISTKPASGLLAVPSFSTLQSLRKSITENGNTCPLTQKHLVQLDWVSKEDGSHILTVAVGSKILLYTPVSSDLAQANIKAMKESHSTNRPLLRKASSLAQPHFNDEIRWMKLRQIDLQTADGLPPLPMQISWVRDGILVVGMDSEMHVYSQWKPKTSQPYSVEDLMDTRNLRDENLRSMVNETTQRRLGNVSSMPHLSRVSSVNLQKLSSDKKKKTSSQSTGHLPTGNDQFQIYDYMTDYGLFQASRIACPVLPQYHPKQLMELLNSGKIRWVKAILAHLVRCMSGPYIQGTVADEENLNRQRAWSRSRTLSVSYVGGINSPNEQRGSTTQIPEELTLDYAEITSIPPLPLWVLLAADKESPDQAKKQKKEVKGYDELFEEDPEAEDSLDDLLENESDSRRFDRRQSIVDQPSVSHFGPRQGQLLSRLLTHTHLPGLSSLDQMHLLALADTVSTCNTDFTDRFSIDAAKTAIEKGNVPGLADADNVSTDSLDDCGLRFLLAMKHYNYLLRCLPLTQRNQFQKQGVGTSNIVWAFHSESEEELLNLIPSYSKGQIKWATLKELGVGWWLRNFTLLKQCIEKLAKAAYQSKQDPLDAAIYYLAMKKKSIVWGLFRSQRDEKMTSFFANNFAEDRWRKAALKNAFVLLGKQRFEHAVAFFLLANSLNDAVEVCLNKLDDFQLALVITRLYEGEREQAPPAYTKLIYEDILGCDSDGNNQDWSKAHPDPFLRSMALWILKNNSGSLNTLLLNNVGTNHPSYNDEDIISKSESNNTTNPNVFNFYIYLRTHPLLIRQFIASTAQEKKRAQVVLSGFSYTGEGTGLQSDKQLQVEDTITPLERQLYFTTAHGHFKAGCPALALEVLSKLPSKVMDSAANSELTSPVENNHDTLINTGILDWSSSNVGNTTINGNDTGFEMDWGAPVSSGIKDDEFKIQWDDEETEEDPDDNSDKGITIQVGGEQQTTTVPEIPNNTNQQEKLDIMAQQLKFVACLKILMEELSTLATGFEVDGGQLRYQLYIWLEREVDALKQLCNYSITEYEISEDTANLDVQNDKDNVSKFSEKPTLHEILLQEKQDFEAKVQRAARRKRWLKANETLLRTLLSYCSLHGASGGGLASVRMELVLLLQELQQEKTQQQLLSPLPFPTTLPLLSACVAGNKTVIADPIKYLQSHTQDMLQTVLELRLPPIGLMEPTFCEIYVLRDLAIALSSCIYQSLCDSESFVVHQTTDTSGYHSPGIENIAKLNAGCQCSHLMVNANKQQRKRKYSSDEPVTISTIPSKWPGVTNLRALLAREKDDDIPRLNVLLLESFVATFMSLLVYGLSTCDCHILYRLVGQTFSNFSWATLFGGGAKKLIRKATSQNQVQTQYIEETPETNPTDNSVWTAVTSLTKQRVKLNMKLLGNFSTSTGTPNMKEDKPTYREQFIPPEMSMVSYFLVKPTLNGDPEEEDYNTDDSAVSDLDIEEEDEDVFSDPLGTSSKLGQTSFKEKKENTEHSNPNSYAWSIMRIAVLKLVQNKLHEFVNTAGIEVQELPVASPLSHGVLRILSTWQDILNEDLQMKGPAPVNFIPGCFIESEIKGPAIHKYRSLLDKSNTPFITSYSAAPARRLWNYLVRQEHVQDVFIRSVFGKKRFHRRNNSHDQNSENFDNSSVGDIGSPGSGEEHMNVPSNIPEPIRIIHKEQESISAFCLNNSTVGLMALATPREIQEMDISLLLDSPNWYEDECEYDIMNLSKDIDTLPTSSFLVIQTAADKHILGQNSQNVQNYSLSTSPQPGIASQSGRGTSVVLKHKVDNIKRMCAHPLMPLYLTGGQDGSVQLWEWGHQQVVCTPRPPGTFAKVTRCRFSQQGNKFGIADGDGNLSLWQAGLATQSNRSFFNYQCHNKGTSDFVFLGSCSLIATAGHNSDNKNVCIWDTLLPQKKALVTSFSCHDQGASSLLYAPQHQVVISAGKKGDVCIFDVRQRTLRQRFQAHETSIKCMAIDPHEELFVTGSADGDIKIWGLSIHNLLYSFLGEHARSSFFKHIGQGVNQLQVDSRGHLFSCGSDGSMKVRQLPDRELIVQSLY